MSVRVATLNVHAFCDANMRDNLQRVSIAVKQHKIDVLGIQEARAWSYNCNRDDDDLMREFCEAIGFESYVYCDAGGIGNAVVSRWPMSNKKHQQLPCYRSIAKSVVETPFGPLSFHCTHLDHVKEATRHRQWKSIVSKLQDEADDSHIIVGDFNALHRDDYDADRWSSIKDVRAKNRWEPPQTSLMEGVLQWGYLDVAAVNKSTKEPNQPGTCRFGTRIDYILLSPGLQKEWKVIQDSYVVDGINSASDHNLVYVDIEKRSN